MALNYPVVSETYNHVQNDTIEVTVVSQINTWLYDLKHNDL